MSGSITLASFGVMLFSILLVVQQASPLFYVPLFIMGLLLMVLAVVEAINE
jgi:hypothetical protein